MVIVEVISTNWQDDYYNKLRDYRDICLPCHDPNYGETMYQEAIGDFQAGLRLKPNDPDALFNLGNAYYVLGKFPDAITQYNKAVSLNRQF